jgi:hypothetical protein
MLHSDVVPEHDCNGELIEVDLAFKSVFAPSSGVLPCGTEFTFEPDSDWVPFVTPGMRGVIE